MFGSWSKARGSSLALAGAAALGVLAVSPAQALEGVQGRNAIFYPSLELVYQHDDNYFLVNDKFEAEKSADTFIAHAHFVLEVPGARQYLRVEYAPQYRDVSVNDTEFDLEDSMSHFWDLDAKLRGSAVFGVDIRQNATRGALEIYELDRSGGDAGSVGREFVKGASEPFLRHNLEVDLNFQGSRQGVRVTLGKEDTGFEDSEDAPAWFELDEWRAGFEYHWKFTPLSKFLVGFEHGAATQDFVGMGDIADTLVIESDYTVDSDRNRFWFGFDGELGRTTTGNARVGYASIDFDETFYDLGGPVYGGEDADWEGIQLRTNITKSFSRWTKLAFGAERSPFYSAYAPLASLDRRNAYYIGNQAFFNLTNQPQGSRVFWALIGQFHRNAYDVETLQDAADVTTLEEREDDIIRFRGEIGFHPIEHLSLRLNYQFEERDSSHERFDYDDNIVAVQVQFGF